MKKLWPLSKKAFLINRWVPWLDEVHSPELERGYSGCRWLTYEKLGGMMSQELKIPSEHSF